MLTAFTVGAKVMLLKNFIVELNIMNGAVGTVKDIVYKEEEGPRNLDNIPAYIIVDFPKCLITDEKRFRWKVQDGRTNVPIPVITERCEKCCSITTVPMRVCKAITIHKGQGITVGKGQDWENVVVYFVEGKGKSQPGLKSRLFFCW